MNIKTYLFRVTIAAAAAVLGISAQQTFHRLDRITRSWLDSASSVLVHSLPFHDLFGKLSGSELSYRASFDPTGEYYLPEEIVPAAFSDFARIEFTMHDYARGVPILPSGGVYADRMYKFATVTMDGDTLTFETEVKGGVSYRFNGKVVRSDNQEAECSTGDLVGSLEKMKNGSVIAAIETTFFLFGN